MESPLARAALCLIGVYVALMFFLVGRDWVHEEYPARPPEPETIDPVQHPYYHEQAVRSLEKFRRLSESEQEDFRKQIDSALVSVEQWTRALDRSDYRLIFLGESHRESTRTFLAEEIFSRISLDQLFLEATPEELDRIVERLDSGRDYFPLLDADILAVLRAVKRRNPNAGITGIEQTREQEGAEKEISGSRDRAIARNFREHYRSGKRQVVLFGALHCADDPNWLYGNIRAGASPALKSGMINIYVTGEHQNGVVEAFVWFLDQLGIGQRGFVISDDEDLPPQTFDLFPFLKNRILDKYSVLMVFRR